MKYTFKKCAWALSAIAALLAAATSCSDNEGEGGKATIKGKVYEIVDEGAIAYRGDLNSATAESFYFVRDTIIAMEEDVYIIYGASGEVYDDKTKTSYTGTYEFPYLRKGDYAIYVIGDEGEVEMKSVSISNSGTTSVEDIYRYNGKNTYKSAIVGKVNMEYASRDEDALAVGARVYLQKKGEITTSDTRTDLNGFFYFTRLAPNTEYTLWCEYETVKNGVIEGKAVSAQTDAAGSITYIAEPLQGKVY